MNNPKPFMHYLWKGPAFDEVDSATRVFFCGREILVTECVNSRYYRAPQAGPDIPLVPWSTKPSSVPVSVIHELMSRLNTYAQPAPEYVPGQFSSFTHLPPPPKIEGSWGEEPVDWPQDHDRMVKALEQLQSGVLGVFSSPMEITPEVGVPRGKSALSMISIGPQFIQGNPHIIHDAVAALPTPPSVAERAAERGKAHLKDETRRLRKKRT